MPSPIHDATTEAAERQLREINREINSDPLLSEPEKLTLTCKLTREYENHDVFYSQVLSLFLSEPSPDALLYSAIRYARRDGNCFYRCFSFRLFELMFHDLEFALQILKIMQNDIRPRMLQQFGEYCGEFCDVAEGLAKRICNKELCTLNSVYEAVTNEREERYFIVYFRYAVSIYLRDHATEFLPFVMGLDFPNVDKYCELEVEPFDKESDNIDIESLGRLFKVTIRIEVLDPKAGKRTSLQIGQKKDEADLVPHIIYLLYRPGHYDLLML